MKNIGIFCASSNNMDAIYYEEAAKLGKWLALNGKSLVYGGANCGLMEAAAKAVDENGGEVVGVVPQILFDRERVSSHIHIIINPHCSMPCTRLLNNVTKTVL